MVRDLCLKGNELLVFAIIYGFCQDNSARYTRSMQYLADWCNSSKESIRKVLISLVEKKLLEKFDKYDDNNVKVVEYATKLHGVCNKVVWGMQQSCINNAINNTNINNTNKEKEKEKEKEKSEAFRLWLDYKRERGQEYRTAASEQCARERLLELSGCNEETALAIVKQSIANNWSGLFELKNENYGNNKSNNAATNAVDRRSESYRRLYEREIAILQSYEASD